MSQILFNPKLQAILFWLSIFIGVFLRVWVSTFGHNFDLDSYWIVSDIILQGKSVYAETERYNYGPVWAWLLGGFRYLAIAFNQDNILAFHTIIAFFLSLTDVAIAIIIKKNYGIAATLFFFLNPVSILITGYHSQFDNLAIFITFAACCLLTKKENYTNVKTSIILASLIGLSLSVKHVCLFFPFWLFWAFKDIPFKIRSIFLVIPYTIFALLFLPYVFDPRSLSGIIENVFKYKSIYGNGIIFPILNFFIDIRLVEKFFAVSLVKRIFILLMIVSVFFWRGKLSHKYDARELLFFYLITMVVLTSSVANQYLVIPLIAVAYYYKHVAAWLYSLTACILLLLSEHNILENNISAIKFIGYQQVQIWLVILLICIWKTSRAKLPTDKDAQNIAQ